MRSTTKSSSHVSFVKPPTPRKKKANIPKNLKPLTAEQIKRLKEFRLEKLRIEQARLRALRGESPLTFKAKKFKKKPPI